MSDDEVEVFVGLADFTGVELCRHLLVEAVPDNAFACRVEVELGMTGNLCVFWTFVNDTRVSDVCAFETDFLCNTVGNQSSQVASVLALNTCAAFLKHKFINAVGSRFARTGKTSTSDNYCNFVGTYAVLLNHVEDGILAVLELVGDFLVLLDFFDWVLDVFSEDFGFSFKYRSLGRSCARIDY